MLTTNRIAWRDMRLPFKTAAARAAPTAAALYADHLADVYRYVSRHLPRREDAEDVTAECFAAAFAALPRFRGECEPRLWLLGIARRQVAAALRRPRHRREVPASQHDALDEAASEAPPPEAAALSREARLELARVLRSLKEPQREALLLHYVEGLTHKEIAAVLKRSEAAVNSLLQRARASALSAGRPYFLNEEVSQ